MTDSLAAAKSLLSSTDSTFAAVNGGRAHTSEKSGIAPILTLLHEDTALLAGASVADKVIGKAAALLLILGEIKELYAGILSEHAKSVLDTRGIPYQYGKCVPYIVNRDGTGMCPMERAVLATNDPGEAYLLLLQALERLKAGK